MKVWIHRRRANRALALILQHGRDQVCPQGVKDGHESPLLGGSKRSGRLLGEKETSEIQQRGDRGEWNAAWDENQGEISPMAKRRPGSSDLNSNPLDGGDAWGMRDEEGDEGGYCSASEDEDFVRGSARGSIGLLLSKV